MMEHLARWLIVTTLAIQGVRGQKKEDTVTVQLKQGAITAMKETLSDLGDDTGSGRFYYSFKGIPYALPPVGGLRFRDPVPPTGWKETRDGSVSPPKCPQLSPDAVKDGNFVVLGNEDCLYLNVYTSRPNISDLPVMVWIHGGAFISGGAEEYAPLALLSKDIVLVSIQYRLGTLGFFSTEDKIMPGNLGLKDQTLALDWVKHNIRKLGGDPSRITLIGQGSGAASAHFQILAPTAAGLFDKAILQSGSALSPWALRNDHRKVAHTVGLIYNCSGIVEDPPTIESTRLLYCLQALSLDDLVPLPSFFTVWQNSPVVMVPRVDGIYLPDYPAALLRDGKYNKVNLISGYTQHEGALASMPLLLNKSMADAVIDDFQAVAPAMLYLENESFATQVAQSIYQFYLGNQKISLDLADQTVQMLSDASAKVTQDEVAALHSATGYVFAYELQHRGQNSIIDLYNSTTGKKWVSHADDLQYLFSKSPYFPQLEKSDDKRVRDLITTLWTNFAATGFPTPNGSLGFAWVAVSPTCLRYLAITTYPFLKNYDRDGILRFWQNLPLQRNQILHPERFSFRPPFFQVPPRFTSCFEDPTIIVRGVNRNSVYPNWQPFAGQEYRLQGLKKIQDKIVEIFDI
ncbi:venom carboxylesterase-6-like isoform X1 [Macrobrachium rosenbergii]|uniref:venom carboxylesterase-6-like isoform X1 n=2 Tax=Macrobrachium rosenbergii TaxID=79674 RepID=UPI0034D69387